MVDDLNIEIPLDTVKFMFNYFHKLCKLYGLYRDAWTSLTEQDNPSRSDGKWPWSFQLPKVLAFPVALLVAAMILCMRCFSASSSRACRAASVC